MSIIENGVTKTPRIAIIGGSGFGKAFLDGEPDTVETKYGAASITRTQYPGCDVFFLARHGTGHSIPPSAINHRANIAALRDLGVDGIYATAAVGSLRTDMAPGQFVIVDDFVDLTRGEPVTFYDQPGDVRHFDMSEPYNQHQRGVLSNCAQAADGGHAMVHPAGTYVCLSGPRYETAAEVRLFALWGCDIVGMTSAPEAILCREAGIPYAAIAVITNHACGLVTGTPLSHEDVEEQMQANHKFLVEVFIRVIAHTAGVSNAFDYDFAGHSVQPSPSQPIIFA
ncbi:MAG: MTAP family purine nucleoside phosphorylase [Capsulimonadaceae bacterium]